VDPADSSSASWKSGSIGAVLRLGIRKRPSWLLSGFSLITHTAGYCKLSASIWKSVGLSLHHLHIGEYLKSGTTVNSLWISCWYCRGVVGTVLITFPLLLPSIVQILEVAGSFGKTEARLPVHAYLTMADLPSNVGITRKMSYTFGINGKFNGVESKTPFLIGVSGGTASGKVCISYI